MGFPLTPQPERAESEGDEVAQGLHLDPVEEWRFHQFLAHGLDFDRAQGAAILRHIDVARFRSLINAGCTAFLAWEILR